MRQKQKNFFSIFAAATLLLAIFLFLQPTPKVFAQTCDSSMAASLTAEGQAVCEGNGCSWVNGECVMPSTNNNQMTCLSKTQQQVDCNTGNPAYCNVNGQQVNCPAQSAQSNCQIFGFTGQACCDAYANDPVCAAFKGTNPAATGPSVANGPCQTPGVQSTCGAGLLCASNLTCQVSNCAIYGFTGQACCSAYANDPLCTANAVIQSTTNSNSGTSGTGSGNCNGDPNLTFSNGLCLPAQSSFPTTGIAGSTTLSGLILIVIQLLLTFAGIIAVIMLILGGYWYMAAGGNEEMSEKGKNTIINFVIGLVVILLAYTIVTILANTLTTTQFTK